MTKDFSFSFKMAIPAKGSALLFLMAFVGATVSGQEVQRKIQVADTIPLTVKEPAGVAFPILLDAPDYNGPYDPFDPTGVIAAQHRQLKINDWKNRALIKSYIPPGLGKLAKKEGIKIALNEGRRFAVSHPKEAAELIGIATKAKALYSNALHKVKSLEEEDSKKEESKKDDGHH